MRSTGFVGQRVGRVGVETPDEGLHARPWIVRVLDRRPWRPVHRLTVHRLAGVESPGEVIGYHRTMFAIRAIGFAVLLVLSRMRSTVDVLPLVGAIGALAVILLVQGLWLEFSQTFARWRRVALAGLVADSAAAWLIGEAFLRNPDWVGYLSYQIVALEAALFFGMAGALISIAASLVVLGVQLVQRETLGFPIGDSSSIAIAASLVVQGFIVGVFARIGRSARADLTTLLRLSGLLAHQESPTRIVQALDGHLRDVLGGRVRSVALRRPDGGYDVLRWRTPEVRVIGPDDVATVSRAAGRDLERDFQERRAVTLAIEPERDETISNGLGLPLWVRSITLVPIHSDGVQTGILPILWDTRRVPSEGELDLLMGLADQTGQAFAQAQLRRARELAATDSLTGLANHRAFQDLLARHIAEARASGGRLAVLFCDLDRFKSVNDRHGHAVGDLLLHRIAEAIRSAARTGDIVARYGGDELAMILPGGDREIALDVGRRLREAVRAVESGMNVDLTVGVALYPDDSASQEDLLARADAAMYAGKRLGGGRVVQASEIGGEI